MSNDFKQQVETEEILDKLLGMIFHEVQIRNGGDESFEILVTLSNEFRMKLFAFSNVRCFSINLDTIHGMPWTIDGKQKEPVKVWSRPL